MKQVCKWRAPNVKILIVDDNMINLKILEEILLSYEMKISTAINGIECLSILQKQKGKLFDIVFMDYMMPEMDGEQTLKKIRLLSDEYYKILPVIALTANEIIGMKENLLEAGFNDYMTKPIDITSLNNCLCKYIPAEMMQIQEEIVKENVCEIQIAGVDTELGLKYSNGNVECYISVLKDLYKEANDQKKKMEQCIEKKDLKGYAVLTHGLKGAAASIGANELANIAREHEFAAKDERIDFIYNNFFYFLQIYDTLLENIEKAIGHIKFNEDIKYINEILKENEIEEIIKLIEMFECDEALDKLNTLRGFILTERQNEKIGAAIELLEELSYEEAENMLLSVFEE